MDTPGRVSVIIPAFNAARFLAYALKSVAAQSYPDREIIVVDDASSDETVDIVRAFDAPITLVENQRQLGVSRARNAGAARATGSWLAFLDADDWWPPTLLADAAPLLQPGRALCYDNVVIEDSPPDGTRVEQCGSRQTLHRQARSWTARIVDRANLALMFDGAPLLKSIVHRADFERAGGFDARFTNGEDFHFHVKLAASGTPLLLVDEPYGYYRVHANQTTAAIAGGKQQDLTRHLESCREWICMFDSLPRELALDPASIRACRVGRGYWGYRFARAAALTAFRSRDWRVIVNRDFVRYSLSSTPTISKRLVAALGTRARALMSEN
jgi:succinoglycan biosynthesis protein ExoO